MDIDFADTSYEGMRELQEIGQKYGVEITCMSLEHDLCQLTKADREADVQKVYRWMDLSKQLGVNTVRIFTGWKKDGIPYETQLAWVYEGIEQICRYALEQDMTLVLENHNDVCLKADEILELMAKVQSPVLKICPDVFNYKKAAGENEPVIDDESFAEIEKLLPYAGNAHVKICEAVQGNRADRYLDIGRLLRRLAANAYDGPLAIEFMWPYMSGEKDLQQELANAIQMLKYQLDCVN